MAERIVTLPVSVIRNETERPSPWTSERSPEGARPAATLIVMAEPVGAHEAAHVLMVQRAANMRFAANAVVFPGGAVDEADMALARRLSGRLAVEDAAARIAAIRETIEEAGIAVGLTDMLPEREVATLRAALHAGESLAVLLDRRGLSVELDALVPFTRWCPQRIVDRPRIFDTRFYVARAPDGAHLASVDETENVRLRWASARAMLADCAAGIEHAIFPTRRTLERLAQGRCVEEVMAFARGYAMEMITPWIEPRGGEPHLCIPEHLGYPVTSEPFAKAQRG